VIPLFRPNFRRGVEGNVSLNKHRDLGRGFWALCTCLYLTTSQVSLLTWLDFIRLEGLVRDFGHVKSDGCFMLTPERGASQPRVLSADGAQP
jgi:hypothetical protein